MKKSDRKLWPWYAVAGMDLLILGAALCAFALFHHVLPQEGGSAIRKIVDLDAPGPQSTENPMEEGEAQPESEGEGEGQEEEDAPAAATEAPPAPADPGDFSATFPDYDTGEGALFSYQSRNVRIAITGRQEDGVTYYVADVYVRHIRHLISAFANGKYGKGQRQHTKDIAAACGAVFAVNGDYYGARSTGVVIRNGELFRDSVSADVCVIYADGRMETYEKRSFDLDAAVANGAYQAWSFGPRLLEDGKAMTEFDSAVKKKNPRCAIGYYAPGHYCFVVVDGRQEGYSVGMTLAELSALFERLGCKTAYNLDGGETAVMVFDGRMVNHPAGGGRKCSDIVGIAEGGAS